MCTLILIPSGILHTEGMSNPTEELQIFSVHAAFYMPIRCRASTYHMIWRTGLPHAVNNVSTPFWLTSPSKFSFHKITSHYVNDWVFHTFFYLTFYCVLHN